MSQTLVLMGFFKVYKNLKMNFITDSNGCFGAIDDGYLDCKKKLGKPLESQKRSEYNMNQRRSKIVKVKLDLCLVNSIEPKPTIK